MKRKAQRMRYAYRTEEKLKIKWNSKSDPVVLQLKCNFRQTPSQILWFYS